MVKIARVLIGIPDKADTKSFIKGSVFLADGDPYFLTWDNFNGGCFLVVNLCNGDSFPVSELGNRPDIKMTEKELMSILDLYFIDIDHVIFEQDLVLSIGIDE